MGIGDNAPPPDDASIAYALLDAASRTQYLLARLEDRDERWKAITPGALIQLGRRYGPRIVIEAVSYAKESGASPESPYPYLEAICADLERTRR